MLRLRDKIRTEMGGANKVAKIHQDGRLTVREHIELLVDEGSFREIGTFVTEPRDGQDFWALPGDGIIGGLATIGARSVVVVANDDTVRRGTNGPRGARKYNRLYDMADRLGAPMIILGQSSGARLPESLQAHHFAENSNSDDVFARLLTRRRTVPVITVVIGPSFGSSSFYAGLSDFVVQIEGTCLALTSPRVIEVATGEKIDMESLGGPRVHASTTGQIDRRVGSADDAYELVRAFLSHLPSRAGTPLPVLASSLAHYDEEIADLIPVRRTRAYDIRKVMARLVDSGAYIELKPEFSRNIVTAVARIGGHPVGIIANQPLMGAGALTPDACRKATRLICMCDGYGLPIIYLADNPGFLVGSAVEQGRALAKAMQMLRAGALASVPKCTVILRKSFGLGFTVMGGGGQVGTNLVLAWPGAEVGFMDPKVAANVIYADEAAGFDEPNRVKYLAERAAELATDFAPYGVASSLSIDEIIEPGQTRSWLARFVSEYSIVGNGGDRPLASWPYW